jgi:hypothetical protein
VIDQNKLSASATKALIEYLGVAAEFVVDDALRVVSASSSQGNLPDELFIRSFFIALGGMLPSSVPFDAVKREIAARYQRA